MVVSRRDVLQLIALTAAGAACHHPRPAPRSAPPQPVARLAPLVTLRLQLAQPPAITAGTFEGRLRGTLVASASRWTPTELRLVLATDAGERVDMVAQVLGTRTTARFETAAPGLAYLTRLIAVGTITEHGTDQVHSLEMLL